MKCGAGPRGFFGGAKPAAIASMTPPVGRGRISSSSRSASHWVPAPPSGPAGDRTIRGVQRPRVGLLAGVVEPGQPEASPWGPNRSRNSTPDVAAHPTPTLGGQVAPAPGERSPPPPWSLTPSTSTTAGSRPAYPAERRGRTPLAYAAAMTDKTYLMRTFGCQMNEHDSERIAGLLEADGMEAGRRRRRRRGRAQHVLHPRERRQQALRQPRPPQGAQERRPDMQIVVGGCLAQKDRDLIVERAPHVDVVFGTHNVRRAAELLAEQRQAGRSLVEILEETAPTTTRRSLGPAGPPRGRPRAGSRSRSAATTRAPSASCRRCGAGRSAGRSTTSSTRSRRWPPTA